jgi:ABC-type branched-subunit amino acid transport system substrate-binding protein
VTPTQITLGTVITLTGPVPGLFKGSGAGTDAYFKYINSLGGVNKRKLVMKQADDALNCNQNQTQTQGLVSQVFAFVGSFAVFDNCGAKVLAQNPTVADVHYLLSDDANKEVNGFSPQPAPPGFRTGPYQYYKQHYPKAITKVGSLWANTSPTTWANQKAAEQSLGYKIIYERAVAPTETDFTADIVRMKDAGVEFWDLRNQNVANIARMVAEAAQQNFHPQVTMTNSEYDASFFNLIADPTAANGILTDQPFAMFLGEDAKSVPEVGLFLKWMKKTHPDVTPDLFAMYSWASAALFVQALKAAPQNPTRADLISALKNIHSFNDNGLGPRPTWGTRSRRAAT